MWMKEDQTFQNICKKSYEQWLDEMEKHPEAAVHCGVKLARDYMNSLQRKIDYLEQQGKLKDDYLRKMKVKSDGNSNTR